MVNLHSVEIYSGWWYARFVIMVNPRRRIRLRSTFSQQQRAQHIHQQSGNDSISWYGPRFRHKCRCRSHLSSSVSLRVLDFSSDVSSMRF
jgi:hypothetical protein